MCVMSSSFARMHSDSENGKIQQPNKYINVLPSNRHDFLNSHMVRSVVCICRAFDVALLLSSSNGPATSHIESKLILECVVFKIIVYRGFCSDFYVYSGSDGWGDRVFETALVGGHRSVLCSSDVTEPAIAMAGYVFAGGLGSRDVALVFGSCFCADSCCVFGFGCSDVVNFRFPLATVAGAYPSFLDCGPEIARCFGLGGTNCCDRWSLACQV